jgi:hypothetical protein
MRAGEREFGVRSIGPPLILRRRYSIGGDAEKSAIRALRRRQPGNAEPALAAAGLVDELDFDRRGRAHRWPVARDKRVSRQACRRCRSRQYASEGADHT